MKKCDLLGKEFGTIKITKCLGKNDNGIIIWQGICSCGKIITGPVCNFRGNKNRKPRQSCFECRKSNLGSLSPLWTGCGEICGSKWARIVGGAKQRKHSIEITIEYAWDLFLKQKKLCALSGVKLEMMSDASLDRIDSNKNYTENNVRWVHKDINLIKQNLSDDYFLKLIYLILNHENLHLTSLEIINNVTNKKLFKGVGNLRLRFFNKLKISATRRNIDFDLNIKDLWELYLKQNGRCALSGIPIYFNQNRERLSASLDRIDSNLSYKLDNVHWVHKDVNKIKQWYTLDYFKFLCKLIYEQNKNNISETNNLLLETR